MKRILLLLYILILVSGVLTKAADLPIHCSEDTVAVHKVTNLLKSCDLPLGEKIIIAAESMNGALEDDYYTTDSVATLRINMEEVSPLMFINNAIALAKASENPGHTDWRTFSRELVDIACRRGDNRGFPSIMYHGADWIADNVARGNIMELTENYSGAVARTKSLDEMTRRRGDFAALADSVTFENVRMTEMGFRTHRIPSLKKETIKKKDMIEELRDGDIILMVPSRDGIDIYDMGFVKFENGMPYFMHVSPRNHRVEVEKEDLARYMALMTKYFQGYRILRVKD